jgi:hypothetical protein
MPGQGDLLGRRALSRATLERQLLLARRELPVAAAVAHLAALNAQDPEPPYLSLWARLAGFGHDALTGAMEDRSLVRGTLLRGTQHLATAADYLAWRPLLQPIMDRIRRTGMARATAVVDPAELAEATRRLLADGPLTRPALGRRLAERWPDQQPAELARAAQLLEPLVHPPPSGTWGIRGPTPLLEAEVWLGRPPAAAAPEELVRRYLAAFGPASVSDLQAWCGLTRLREPVEALGPALRRFRDEAGRTLYDLPDAPRPDPGTPAPVRLLPFFDNLLLAHADRTRVMTDEHRRRVCDGAVTHPTVLLDGQVAAVWRIVREGDLAVLEVGPLHRLAGADPAAVAAEGERLLGFAAADATDREVRFVAPWA